MYIRLSHTSHICVTIYKYTYPNSISSTCITDPFFCSFFKKKLHLGVHLEEQKVMQRKQQMRIWAYRIIKRSIRGKLKFYQCQWRNPSYLSLRQFDQKWANQHHLSLKPRALLFFVHLDSRLNLEIENFIIFDNKFSYEILS